MIPGLSTQERLLLLCNARLPFVAAVQGVNGVDAVISPNTATVAS